MIWMHLAVAMAAEPTFALEWKGRASKFTVQAPAGEHIAEEAPFSIQIEWDRVGLQVEGLGDQLASGISLGDVRGASISGYARLSLCEDGGTLCRLVDARFEGEAEGRKGKVTLESVAAVEEDVEMEEPASQAHSSVFGADAQAAFEKALERAARADRVLVVDFGAIWCPPCNMMSAEVFDVRPKDPRLDSVEIVMLDVDDPSSWNVKDRYHVAGYPTLVAVNGEGEEIRRLQGYPGPEETLSWIEEVSAGDLARDPASEALDAVLLGDKVTAARLLHENPAPTNPVWRQANVLVDAEPDDVKWLIENAPDTLYLWIDGAFELVRNKKHHPMLEELIRLGLQDARPADAAHMMELSAQLSDSMQGREAAWAAAAWILESGLTGEPALDKGYYTWLSDLQRASGNTAAAEKTLLMAAESFPDEPTFHRALAGFYLRIGEPERAEEPAQLAVELSWGDNLLVSAEVLCNVLSQLGRPSEASMVARQALDKVPVPQDGMDVRTNRYRQSLEEWLPGGGQ